MKKTKDIVHTGVDSEEEAHAFVARQRTEKQKDYAIEYSISMQATTGGFGAGGASPQAARKVAPAPK